MSPSSRRRSDGPEAATRDYAEVALRKLRERIAGNELLLALLELEAQGVDKAREQAHALGRPAVQIHEARRVLSKHVAAVEAELRDADGGSDDD